jgi:hypothetical protein
VGEWLTHSGQLVLPSSIALCLYCIDGHQHLINRSLGFLCWVNQSRNIWHDTTTLLHWSFRIHDPVLLLYIGFIFCNFIVFASIWIVQVALSSSHNFRCPKWFQVRYPNHFQLYDGRFSRFSGLWILELVLQQCPMQTTLVAMVVLLTIWMQPQLHFTRVTWMLWQSFWYPKYIQWLSSTRMECEIQFV